MPGMFEDILESDKHTILIKTPDGKYKVEQARLSRRQLEQRLEDYVNGAAEIAEMLEFMMNLYGMDLERVKTLMALEKEKQRPAAAGIDRARGERIRPEDLGSDGT